jgi:hypothetical protein
LLAALRCKGRYPLLAISGEQASAKSTLCKLLPALAPDAALVRAIARGTRAHDRGEAEPSLPGLLYGTAPTVPTAAADAPPAAAANDALPIINPAGDGSRPAAKAHGLGGKANGPEPGRIDKSVLTISTPKRHTGAQ